MKIQSDLHGDMQLLIRAGTKQRIVLNTNDKSASTYQFTLSALDAKRSDEAVYSIAYTQKAKL